MVDFDALAAAEKVDVDRLFASYSNAYKIGFTDNGVFIPSLDEPVADFRESFATAQSQDINVAETRVAVLGPNGVGWHGPAAKGKPQLAEEEHYGNRSPDKRRIRFVPWL